MRVLVREGTVCAWNGLQFVRSVVGVFKVLLRRDFAVRGNEDVIGAAG